MEWFIVAVSKRSKWYKPWRNNLVLSFYKANSLKQKDISQIKNFGEAECPQIIWHLTLKGLYLFPKTAHSLQVIPYCPEIKLCEVNF